jgi:hypothetical protein
MTILFSTVLVSCASAPKSHHEKILDHISQGKKYQDGEFNIKFKVSGNDGMNVRSVGISVVPYEYNEMTAKAQAVSDAKFKLVISAPTEFKAIVQRAIGTSLGYQGEYNQIETSISKVHNLQGIEVNESDVTCKVLSSPTRDGGYKYQRECRAIAKVSVLKLNEAYNFTTEQVYGVSKKNKVQKLLQKQLKQKTLKPLKGEKDGREIASK